MRDLSTMRIHVSMCVNEDHYYALPTAIFNKCWSIGKHMYSCTYVHVCTLVYVRAYAYVSHTCGHVWACRWSSRALAIIAIVAVIAIVAIITIIAAIGWGRQGFASVGFALGQR